MLFALSESVQKSPDNTPVLSSNHYSFLFGPHRFVICSNGILSQFGRCPTGQVFEPAIANCMDIGRAVRRDCSNNQRGGKTAAIQRYCRAALDKLTSIGLTPR